MAKTNSITTAARVAQPSTRKLEAPCNVLSLVPNTVSEETLEELEFLCQEARAGRVVGLACVAIGPRYSYVVNTSGEANRHPTFTRGAIRALDDLVREKVRRV